MQTKEQTLQDYFKSLTIIRAALLTGQVLLGSAAFYFILNGQLVHRQEDLYDIIQIVAPLLVIGSLLGSSLLIKSQLKMIRKKEDLIEKLGGYRAALIIKYSLLEGASLIAIVSYLLTADYILLGLAGLLIAIFFISKPSRKKSVKDLDLNQSERDLIFKNPDPSQL